jgi:hypothetical protein
MPVLGMISSAARGYVILLGGALFLQLSHGLREDFVISH